MQILWRCIGFEGIEEKVVIGLRTRSLPYTNGAMFERKKKKRHQMLTKKKKKVCEREKTYDTLNLIPKNLT